MHMNVYVKPGRSLASSPGHSQILSRSRGEKSGSGLGTRLLTVKICKLFHPIPYSLENTPMGDELKWLLNEGVGCIFESCDISHENMPTSHAVSLALVI